jgi:RNA polymerase sigma-70 factor (ECF subfamily)
MLSEQELIEKCICGDRIAQKQLYDKYNALFFAICLRYMPTREDAEDILIMGFTAIFTRMNTFKQKGSFEGWMKRIIVNTAITALRSNSRHYEVERGHEDPENKGEEEAINMTYSRINTADILAQIQQLPEGYRTIFNLYAIEGYSYEEIAQLLQINIGTVRSQLSKARKSLQKKLQAFKR